MCAPDSRAHLHAGHDEVAADVSETCQHSVRGHRPLHLQRGVLQQDRGQVEAVQPAALIICALCRHLNNLLNHSRNV